jgi:hypothetical protein
VLTGGESFRGNAVWQVEAAGAASTLLGEPKMHDLFVFANAVMTIGYIVEKQFPHRRHPWNKIGVAMICLSIIGGIVLTYRSW